ncbi:CatB-related O-acetyltransferase [Vibrio vulnificus]|nr:CatB-related O-acetyltransferase [Vibrio vulnificus]
MLLLQKIYTIFLSFWYYFLSKSSFCKWGIFWGVKLDSRTNLGDWTRIYKRCDIRGTSVGYGTYIGWDSIIRNACIGKYCSIGPNVQVIYGRHPVREFISTHPAFFSTRKQAGFSFVEVDLYQENRTVNNKSLFIGNDVWIGSGVNILEGVSIGDGAVLGANSTVTKDIEPYAIYVGSPAKKIGMRYSEEIIDDLLELQWWDFSPSELKKRNRLFIDVRAFIKSFQE